MKRNNNFTQQCKEYLQSAEAVLPHGALNKTLTYFVDWENPEGTVYYEPESDYWEISDVKDELLGLHINADQTVEITTCDGDNSFLTTYVDSPSELSELFEFMHLSKESELLTCKMKQSKLSDVIDSIYITIPIKDEVRLWESSEITFTSLPIEIRNRIISLKRREMEDLRSWQHFLEEGDLYSKFEDLVDIGPHDILINDKFSYALDEINCTDLPLNIYPNIVLRVNDQYSSLFLRDYLNYTTEGSRLRVAFKKIIYRNSPLNDVILNMPEKKVNQIQKSIELRAHLRSYRETLNELIDLPDPYDGIVDRYKKRIERLKSIHSDFS